MLNVSRKIASITSRRHILLNSRCIYSGRVPQYWTKTTYSDTTDNAVKREGYGEKEICLLEPIDIRTPLPGNMGIPHPSLLYTSKIKELPKPAGEHAEVIRDPSPEEKYHNLISQAVCVAAEKTLTSSKLECAGYECPKLLKEDFLDLFPSRDLKNESLTVVTFSQQTDHDMSRWSEEAESERETIEYYFTSAASAVCAYLKHFGYWADFIHPNTGKPNFAPVTNATMFATDRRYRHFGFSIDDLGCCKVITHQSWGTHVFTGAIFTNAPLHSREIQDVVNRNVAEISVLANSEV